MADKLSRIGLEVVSQRLKQNEAAVEVEEKPQVQAKMQADIQTFTQTSTINTLKTKIKAKNKKLKLEERNKRATYWLAPEELKMLDVLSRATGTPKYELVGIAIRELYKELIK